MSAESSISENIEEEISASGGTNNTTEEETQIQNLKGDKLDNVLDNENEKQATDQESLTEHEESVTSEVSKKRAHENEVGLDSVATKRQAIEKFCSDEAEKIIKEAILIKHVLDEDKSQFDANKVEIDKITGERRQGNGYDRYLIDKLLHSEPDPSEETFEQVEGIEAEIKDDGNTDENRLDNTEEQNGGEFDQSKPDYRQDSLS